MTDIEQRRTVHGGDDSALYIEIRGWRFDGDGYASTVAITAQGFGVYLHNPLAMHLRDFEPGIASREQALAAAVEWADALGEHLGCKVYCWGFNRSDLAAPAAPEFPIDVLCDAAATLWEAALDLREQARRGDPVAVKLNSRWEAEGTAAIRQMVANYATACETAWQALSADKQDELGPFDWEWVPVWLRERLEIDL